MGLEPWQRLWIGRLLIIESEELGRSLSTTGSALVAVELILEVEFRYDLLTSTISLVKHLQDMVMLIYYGGTSLANSEHIVAENGLYWSGRSRSNQDPINHFTSI